MANADNVVVQNFGDSIVDGPPAVGRLHPGQRREITIADLNQAMTHPGAAGLFATGRLAVVDLRGLAADDPRNLPPTARCRWFLDASKEFSANEPPKESMLRVFDMAVERFGAEFSYDPNAQDGDQRGFVAVVYTRRATAMDMELAKAIWAVRRAIAHRIRAYEVRHGAHAAGFSRPR